MLSSISRLSRGLGGVLALGKGSLASSIAGRVSRVLAPAISHCLEIVRGMANHRHKKVLKLAKGFRGRSSRCFTVAYHRVQKARQYAYRDRKVKKRDFRKLWIQRINAGTRMYGLTYSMFINSMSSANVVLNRKVLADIAMTEPLSFKSVVEVVSQKAVKPKAPVHAPTGRPRKSVTDKKSKSSSTDEENKL